MEFLHPPGWPSPSGYSYGVAANGRMVFVAGLTGAVPGKGFETDEFAAQFEQALRNTVAVLAEGGANPADIVRMTVYVTDRQAYLDNLSAVGAAWRAVIGRHYPAMALVAVAALVDDGALVEIETTAVVSEPG